MELSAGSHGLPGRGRGSGISAARHWVSHPTGGWNCAAAVVFSRGRWWSFRLSAPGEIEAANGPYRGKKGTVLVGLGGYQMFDSLAIDRDCVATFISGVAATSGPTTKTSPFN